MGRKHTQIISPIRNIFHMSDAYQEYIPEKKVPGYNFE
jgi:hypothetical protein